jgi:hypothetical protein
MRQTAYALAGLICMAVGTGLAIAGLLVGPSTLTVTGAVIGYAGIYLVVRVSRRQVS